jgi:peptidoglycan pentaglycine glycine transferase (the first glycine)
MVIKEIKDKNLWESFFKGIEKRTFLNSWNWGEFRKIMGDKIWRVAILNDSEEIDSLFLAHRINTRKGDYIFLPHFIFFKSKEGLELSLEKIKDIAKKEKVSFIRIAPIYENESLAEKVIDDFGFKLSPSLVFPTKSWELILRKEEHQILSEMKKEHSRKIRRALKNKDIEIIVSKDRKNIKDFYSLIKETSKRQKFKPFSFSYIEKEFDIFSRDDQVLIFLGFYKKELVAGAFIVFWSKKGFYHHGASLPLKSKISVPHLIQWEAIKEAKKRGCYSYDFWSIAPTDRKNHKWFGLTYFKKGFGGKEINYSKTRDFPLSKKYLITYFFEKMKKGNG